MPCSTDFRSCPEKELNHYQGVESVKFTGKLREKKYGKAMNA